MLELIKPEFFDIFGIIGFLFIIFLSIRFLKRKLLPKWLFIILLIIGIFGFIIDSLVVYKFYLR